MPGPDASEPEKLGCKSATGRRFAPLPLGNRCSLVGFTQIERLNALAEGREADEGPSATWLAATHTHRSESVPADATKRVFANEGQYAGSCAGVRSKTEDDLRTKSYQSDVAAAFRQNIRSAGLYSLRQ